MRITILTLFPSMFSPLKESILKRAQNQGKILIEIVDIREFSTDKHKKCDDIPYGGGAGMIMTPQPIYDATKAVETLNCKKIFMSPKGEKFSQNVAQKLCKEQHIILLCGHYEGVDQRALDICEYKELSIGDYVLTGGELPAMVVTETICRLVDGVIAKNSLNEESFSAGLLEYPQYTRPLVFNNNEVPKVLYSGNHQQISAWRAMQSEIVTKKNRKDLYRIYLLKQKKLFVKKKLEELKHLQKQKGNNEN
ncbi:MAG: tRNA (guanosine(37)-N1)-methyltransferase TrmD [Clostridia bacterium]